MKIKCVLSIRLRFSPFVVSQTFEWGMRNTDWILFLPRLRCSHGSIALPRICTYVLVHSFYLFGWHVDGLSLDVSSPGEAEVSAWLGSAQSLTPYVVWFKEWRSLLGCESPECPVKASGPEGWDSGLAVAHVVETVTCSCRLLPRQSLLPRHKLLGETDLLDNERHF